MFRNDILRTVDLTVCVCTSSFRAGDLVVDINKTTLSSTLNTTLYKVNKLAAISPKALKMDILMAPCNLRSGVMEWSRGVEWSLEWSGVESGL